jgi:hypothetical protein
MFSSPWKVFKESCDRNVKQSKQSASGGVRTSSARASAGGVRSARADRTIIEETIKEEVADSKEASTFKMIREVDENYELNQSDDETMKFNYSSSDDDTYSYVYKDTNKVLKRRKARNQYSDITKEFQSEELKIKVIKY